MKNINYDDRCRLRKQIASSSLTAKYDDNGRGEGAIGSLIIDLINNLNNLDKKYNNNK